MCKYAHNQTVNKGNTEMVVWYIECNGKAFFTFLANIEAYERWQLNHHESAWIVPGTIEA